MLRTAAACVKRGMASKGPSLDIFAPVFKAPMGLVTEGEQLRVGSLANAGENEARLLNANRHTIRGSRVFMRFDFAKLIKIKIDFLTKYLKLFWELLCTYLDLDTPRVIRTCQASESSGSSGSNHQPPNHMQYLLKSSSTHKHPVIPRYS